MSAGPAIVVGMFDGVHRGHRQLVRSARQLAEARGVDLEVLTFDPHPREVLAGAGPGMLCSLEQRVGLLEGLGVSRVHVQQFTRSFSQLTPEQFVEQVLVDRLRASAVIVGRNFRFGARASGDVTVLQELCAARGISVDVHDLVSDGGQAISSSSIRDLLAAGDVVAANALLGRPYELDGVVVHGARRGRELGMRTANLHWDERRVVCGDGVYAGTAEVDAGEFGQLHVAAISVGTNPQFNADGRAPRTVEAHLLDVDAGDILYDLPMRIGFRQRIRGQETFSSLEGLVAQMRADVAEVRRLASQPER